MGVFIKDNRGLLVFTESVTTGLQIQEQTNSFFNDFLFRNEFHGTATIKVIDDRYQRTIAESSTEEGGNDYVTSDMVNVTDLEPIPYNQAFSVSKIISQFNHIKAFSGDSGDLISSEQFREANDRILKLSNIIMKKVGRAKTKMAIDMISKGTWADTKNSLDFRRNPSSLKVLAGGNRWIKRERK